MKSFSWLTLALLLFLATSLAACGGSANAAQAKPPGDPAIGRQLFLKTCAACHGQDGRGLPGLGKNLTTSEFVAGKSDEELVEFIKVGRGPDDPLNTTGVTMPPKGNNAALTDQDLFHLVAYLRTLRR